MSFTAILAPLFVQVALTFALLFWMGSLRINAVKAGAVHLREIALGQPNWTPQATQVANAFHNQFQLPVLYYLLIILILVVAPATPFMVPLSWAFVATRLLHTLIYVTTNNVPRRFVVYTTGLAILCLMWLILVAEIVFGL